MKQREFCAYPPQLAADVEISQTSGGENPSFVIGSSAAGHYLRLGITEHRVIKLLDGTPAPLAVCSAMQQAHGINLHLATLTRFLTRLDAAGILAGQRFSGRSAAIPGNRFYLHWMLFNPDRLFTRVSRPLRWIWTSGFLAASLLLIALSAVIAVANWTEIASYAGQIAREHYPAVLLVAWIVIVSHEFAHGLTSKAFGGRATEIGALLIYYCLPALYCNVSGLYLIAERRRRLWVIAAGVYWQLLVGAAALLAWFLLAHHTVAADLAMIFVLGSFLNIVFNANPLIKLDGYYFLSQWLQLPNLMDRSRAYWRGVLFGRAHQKCRSNAPQTTSRERRIFLVFGFLSFSYNLVLPLVVFWYVFEFLTDHARLPGLLLSLALPLIFARDLIKSGIRAVLRASQPKQKFISQGDDMTSNEMAITDRSKWRSRRHLALALPVVAVGILFCIPWTASVGSYGALMTLPDQETAIRAPEDGSIISLNVRAGQHVEKGTLLGSLGNLDLEEQIAQIRTELARAEADFDRLAGGLRLQQQETVSAELRSSQRRREFREVQAEEQQILDRSGSASKAVTTLASFSSDQPTMFGTPADGLSNLPAVLAALEANANVRRTKLAEATGKLQRARQLFAEGILARSELDAADSNALTLASDLNEAEQHLKAALVDHRRRHEALESEFQLSRSSVTAAHAEATSLRDQLQATHRLTASLEERLAILESKRSRFTLTAPISGTVLNEELARMSGRYLSKGDEICRIVGLRDLLVRVQVPEREIGDVKAGEPVRIKARAFPGRVFRGEVSHIGDEGDLVQDRQTTYRVELRIRNNDGLLRPGMTVFGRIDFDRRPVVWILAHKLEQALRPELWML